MNQGPASDGCSSAAKRAIPGQESGSMPIERCSPPQAGVATQLRSLRVLTILLPLGWSPHVFAGIFAHFRVLPGELIDRSLERTEAHRHQKPRCLPRFFRSHWFRVRTLAGPPFGPPARHPLRHPDRTCQLPDRSQLRSLASNGPVRQVGYRLLQVEGVFVL